MGGFVAPILGGVASAAAGSLFGGKGGGSGGGTTTQTTQLDPDFKQRLLALIDRATAVSETPYQPYGGARVQGFAPDQLQGFDQVRRYAQAGIAPNQFAQDVTAAETGFDPFQGPTSIPELDLTEYLNPFTDLVASRVEDEMRRYGQIEDQQADARAAAAGAFGGDRAGLARAELSRNRDTTLGNTLAQLYRGGYDTATQLATGDLNRRMQAGLSSAGLRLGAAQQLAGLGQQEQALGLQGAAALENIGQQYQTLGQRSLDTGYQDFLEQRNWPYQNVNFLNSVVNGSPLGREGTSTSVAPQPSALGQIAGLGLAGAGLVGATGGFGTNGWLSNLFSSGGGGGQIEWRRRGGRVRPKPYADGGYVDEGDQYEIAGLGDVGTPSGLFDVDQDYPADENEDPPELMLDFSEELVGSAGEDRMQSGLAGPMGEAYEADLSARALSDRQGGPGTMSLRREGTGHRAFTGEMKAGIGRVSEILKRSTGHPDDKRDVPGWALPMTVAGFAMMASRNPSALGAAGEGGLAAIKTYVDNQKLEALREYRRDQAEAKRQQLAQQGAYRAGQLEVARDRNRVQREAIEARNDPELRRSQIDANKARAAASRAAAARHFDAIGAENWSTPQPGRGMDEDGNLVEGAYTMDRKSGEMRFKPGAVLTSKSGVAGQRGTALERNVTFVAKTLGVPESEALRIVQQGKNDPATWVRVENRYLADITAQNALLPRRQQKSPDQLKAEAATHIKARREEIAGQLATTTPAPAAAAEPPAAAASGPPGFTERYTHQDGRQGWRNPKTGQIALPRKAP